MNSHHTGPSMEKAKMAVGPSSFKWGPVCAHVQVFCIVRLVSSSLFCQHTVQSSSNDLHVRLAACSGAALPACNSMSHVRVLLAG